ncbi:hypothetical protein BC936DRAFT_140230 [Jimgerdemannia flammicorona]|uniref:Integrator complex subunit 7 N-terminal domain-containing protein n=1 Tax=Jimgerdemannia flammicorona TaxID=994334 RepID=A0A433AVQ9_9FUNG|nr:hypothetical protein BC936DRAFT_140230 [Jimgerdemannia flammicorona]
MQQPATWLVTTSLLSTTSQTNDDSSTTASEKQRHDFTQALNALETRFLNNLKTVKVKVPPGALLQVIAQFPKLFEDYPLPVLINSAILKLADWFRQHSSLPSSSVGNNLIRFYIYKVIKSASERHLSKVINVEELVRRILSVVMLNNDTIARAITLSSDTETNFTLYTFLARIIHRLDKSTEHVEIDAAICAADRICARSEQFPGAICARLAAKLEGKLELGRPIKM